MCLYYKKKIHKNLNYTKANQNRESKICQQKYPRYVNARKAQKMFTALCEFNKKKWNLQIQKIKTNKFDNSYKEIIEQIDLYFLFKKQLGK